MYFHFNDNYLKLRNKVACSQYINAVSLCPDSCKNRAKNCMAVDPPPNAVMISEQRMGKDLEGTDRGLICGNIPYIFMTGSRKTTRNFS